MSLDAFSPAGTASLAVTTSTGTVAFAAGGHNKLIYNSGTVTAFIKVGSSTVTAAVTDTPVPPGVYAVFNFGDATHVAAITASGTPTLYFTTGDGL